MGVNGHCRDSLRESLYLSALEVPSQELLTRLAPLLGRVLLVVSTSDKHCHHPAEGLWSVCICVCGRVYVVCVLVMAGSVGLRVRHFFRLTRLSDGGRPLYASSCFTLHMPF